MSWFARVWSTDRKKFLLGGVMAFSSSFFEDKEDAEHWLAVIKQEQPHADGRVHRSNEPHEIPSQR
jgi:hypothetical protein